MNRSDEDKKLWRRYASERRPPERGKAGEGARGTRAAITSSQPSPIEGEGEEMLQLAAWLDGRLEGAEREAVEAWLAARPDRLDLALSAAGAKDLAAVWPDRVQGRAFALVPSSRPPLRLFAAAAAAAVLLALGGFELGSVGSEALSAGSETDLAAEIGLVPETDVMEKLL